jgi:AcrR family transcriptional regulator
MKGKRSHALLEEVVRSTAAGDKILDAALEQFQKHGMGGATVEDIAQAAGLSRITVYRHFPSKSRLIAATMLRELRRGLIAIDEAIAHLGNVEERFVEGFVATLRVARRHPLLQKMLATEPEMVLPFFAGAGGPILAAATSFLADHIRRAQATGAVRRFDPESAAELLVRLAQSFILNSGGVFELEDDRRTRAFARRYLAPIVLHLP